MRNIYAFGSTNEAIQCRKIARACKTALERCGFEARTNETDGTNAMYERVDESNAWGADLHICIHTNAGGGKGVEAYVYETTSKRLAAAQPIYNEIRRISLMGSSRGVKTASFYELKYTSAVCVYVEVDFHDNKDIAKWIVMSTTQIGEAICKGVCEYFNRVYLPPDYKNESKTAATQTVTLSLKVLSKGSEGAEVKTVQRILRVMGYKDAEGNTLAIDGDFGAATDYALRRFQTKKLGSANGKTDEKTWAKLITE